MIRCDRCDGRVDESARYRICDRRDTPDRRPAVLLPGQYDGFAGTYGDYCSYRCAYTAHGERDG